MQFDDSVVVFIYLSYQISDHATIEKPNETNNMGFISLCLYYVIEMVAKSKLSMCSYLQESYYSVVRYYTVLCSCVRRPCSRFSRKLCALIFTVWKNRN